jgi:outer membrane protein insertion porin family
METHASRWYRSRYFRRDLLDKDVDVITDRYLAAGYTAADVKWAAARTAGGEVVTVSISEGARTVTGNVVFEGNAVLPSDELSGVVRLVTGVPFNERLLEEDRFRILNRYAERGYLNARVEADKLPAAGAPAGPEGPPAAAVMDIRYRITEGPQVLIGTVILRGNAFTRDAVIMRELEPRTGEPYNYEAILKSQQRVYRYGYFSLARFEPAHEQEREDVKDMLFTVEERPAGAVEFGVGYGDLDRFRGFVEVSHRNLWRSAHYASVRVEGSDILQRTAFTYRMPWFLGYRSWESKTILAWSDSKRINQDTREVYYQTRKTSASYGIERLDHPVKPSLTYQFENVDNYNVQQEAELTPEDSGRVRISSLTPAVVWDLRDSIFDPRRGSVHGITVKEAMSLVGSKADFTKATVQTTWFFPAKDFAVLALSGRAGMAWPHKDTPEVPIHERFYLGGSTTVRGYLQDSIGPPTVEATSSKIPTGGSSMVQLNAEVRMGSAEGFGVVVFSDAGNVWVDQRIRLDDLRASYGAGIRYHTPVGPLRIDYGQKIHRRPGESPGELHFTIGHAF